MGLFSLDAHKTMTRMQFLTEFMKASAKHLDFRSKSFDPELFNKPFEICRRGRTDHEPQKRNLLLWQFVSHRPF